MMRLIAVRYGMGGCGAHELSLCAAELTVSHHSLPEWFSLGRTVRLLDSRLACCVEQCSRLSWSVSSSVEC